MPARCAAGRGDGRRCTAGKRFSSARARPPCASPPCALRRFPVVGEMLREGRLCLSTVRLLEPLLTDDGAPDLLARAAGKSKSEVERLVVSIQPRAIPKEGLRKVPDRSGAAPAAALSHAPPPIEPGVTTNAPREPVAIPAAPVDRARLRPVAEDTYSLTVTVDVAFKDELEQMKALLSHKIPGGNVGAVLREAVRCAIEKHGKRRGTVEPTRKAAKKARGPQSPAPDGTTRREPIPAHVKREVWKRDVGCCTFIGPDGRRCGSTWKLEFHHLMEAALGGPSTVDNITLRCRAHNVFHAEETFGREHMEQFRRKAPRTGEVTDSGKVPRSGHVRADGGLIATSPALAGCVTPETRAARPRMTRSECRARPSPRSSAGAARARRRGRPSRPRSGRRCRRRRARRGGRRVAARPRRCPCRSRTGRSRRRRRGTPPRAPRASRWRGCSGPPHRRAARAGGAPARRGCRRRVRPRRPGTGSPALGRAPRVVPREVDETWSPMSSVTAVPSKSHTTAHARSPSPRLLVAGRLAMPEPVVEEPPAYAAIRDREPVEAEEAHRLEHDGAARDDDVRPLRLHPAQPR